MIYLYNLKWFIGKNLEEIKTIIKLNNIPIELVPCADSHGTPLAYMLKDNTGKLFDLYFGGYGETHFYLPLTNIVEL